MLNIGMNQCSTVISFDYDVELLSKWRTVIMEHQDPKHNGWVLEHLNLDAMTIDQMPFKIMPDALYEDVAKSVAPINIIKDEHCCSIERLKPNTRVDLHIDHAMNFSAGPLVRKTNVLFNLSDRPCHIIHEQESENKSFSKGEILILNVTKSHGADNSDCDEWIDLFGLNLRMTYSDTVEYFKTLL